MTKSHIYHYLSSLNHSYLTKLYQKWNLLTLKKSHSDTAQTLTTFFLNIISNLEFAEYANYNPISDNSSNPVKAAGISFSLFT